MLAQLFSLPTLVGLAVHVIRTSNLASRAWLVSQVAYGDLTDAVFGSRTPTIRKAAVVISVHSQCMHGQG